MPSPIYVVDSDNERLPINVKSDEYGGCVADPRLADPDQTRPAAVRSDPYVCRRKPVRRRMPFPIFIVDSDSEDERLSINVKSDDYGGCVADPGLADPDQTCPVAVR